ncbi:hypothetical protein Tco_1048749 [Tanacetum coccineum]
MTSITAQQTKLDLELVPKENRHGTLEKQRKNHSSELKPKQRGNIFKLFPGCTCTHNKVQFNQHFSSPECPLKYLSVCPRIPSRDFDALPSKEDTLSFLRDLGHNRVTNSPQTLPNDVRLLIKMHQPLKKPFAVNTQQQSICERLGGLENFVFLEHKSFRACTTEENVDYVELLWEDFTYQIDNQSLQKARKDILPHVSHSPKKASPSKKESELVPGDEEPIKKGKRLKTPAKKSASKPATSIVIREHPVETKMMYQKNRSLIKQMNLKYEDMKSDKEQVKDETTEPNLMMIADARLEEPLRSAYRNVSRLGETREEFMNFLSESLTTRIKEQVKDQLPQILPREVSNFAPPVIEKLIKESRDEVTLAKASSQPQSTYEAASTLTEFDVAEKTRIKMKTLLLDQTEGTKSQPRSFGKSVQSEEPVFEVADSDMPHDQEGNLGDNEDEPKKETASRSDWFKKPTPPQEPTDPDWNVGKMTKEGPTQTWLMNLAASNPTDKSLKDFDELISTPIDFSSFVLNGLKIKNLTQEILLGPAFRLLKGTRSNYAELEYYFEECYKALSEKLDWENPEGGDYPFDLSKPLPLIMRGKHQRVPFEFFINNDLKYLQGGISTMTYTTSTIKTKAAKYDLPGIEDMVPNIWSPVKVAYDKGDVYSTKRILAVTHVKVIRKHGYGYLEEIVVRRADNILYRFKEGDFLRLRINDIVDMLILAVQNRLTNLSGDDVADFAIALRMFTRSLVIQRRVEDLQLGVESYQKQINVTKPDTTRPDLRKRHPYTP